MRRSCEAAATSWRRASSISRRERSSIARRTASAAASAAPAGREDDQQDLGGAHPARDRDRGGAGEEGGDRDDDGALHGRNL